MAKGEGSEGGGGGGGKHKKGNKGVGERSKGGYTYSKGKTIFSVPLF